LALRALLVGQVPFTLSVRRENALKAHLIRSQGRSEREGPGLGIESPRGLKVRYMTEHAFSPWDLTDAFVQGLGLRCDPGYKYRVPLALCTVRIRPPTLIRRYFA